MNEPSSLAVAETRPSSGEAQPELTREQIGELRTQIFNRIASEIHTEDKITTLARMTYVRALFKYRLAAGGRADKATDQARQLTAEVLSKQLGFALSVEEVSLIIEDDEPENTPPVQTETSAAATRRPSAIKTL